MGIQHAAAAVLLAMAATSAHTASSPLGVLSSPLDAGKKCCDAFSNTPGSQALPSGLQAQAFSPAAQSGAVGPGSADRISTAPLALAGSGESHQEAGHQNLSMLLAGLCLMLAVAVRRLHF